MSVLRPGSKASAAEVRHDNFVVVIVFLFALIPLYYRLFEKDH